MTDTHHVFLVPGFFGFTSLGDLSYFEHVRRELEGAAARVGARLAVHEVASPPTASIRTRALTLFESIVAQAEIQGPIHLVGHSTGGLDARLVASPGASLVDGKDLPLEEWASRIRTVLTVATPHRGAPAASFFRTVFGRELLQALSLLTVGVLGLGRLPVLTVATVARAARRLDQELDWPGGLVHALEQQLLRGFTSERRDEVVKFLREVASEGSLITQLTPDGVDLLNAGISERPGVRYGSIVTCARRPGVRSVFRVGPSPSALAFYALYSVLHRIAGRNSGAGGNTLSRDQAAALKLGLGSVPGFHDNDGVVPTLSQPWGSVVSAVWADHLDVIGHFDAERASPPHHDWLSSGTRFGPRQFEETWRKAFAFLQA